LGFRLPIAGLAGDQQSALFGQGCTRTGMAKNTYGTGAFLLVHAGDTVPQLRPACWVRPRAVPRASRPTPLEGSVFIAGAAIQWLRDGLGVIATAAETQALAMSVGDTGGVAFVPAFVGLGTPHWEAEARGTITGITRGTTRAHLVRAAVESIAYGTADLLRAVTESSALDVPVLRVDGGAPPMTSSCSSRPTCSACRSNVPPCWKRPHSARRRWPESRPASGRRWKS